MRGEKVIPAHFLIFEWVGQQGDWKGKFLRAWEIVFVSKAYFGCAVNSGAVGKNHLRAYRDGKLFVKLPKKRGGGRRRVVAGGHGGQIAQEKRIGMRRVNVLTDESGKQG